MINVNNQRGIDFSIGLCFINSFNNGGYFHRVRKCPSNDFSGKQVHNVIKVYKAVLRPNVSDVSTPNGIRTFRVKLFIKNVVKFFAEIGVSRCGGPRFNLPGSNAHFAHVFTYGAFGDDFASLAELLSNFWSTIVLLGFVVDFLDFLFYSLFTLL